MTNGSRWPVFRRRARISLLVLGGALLAGYLALVWAGGGWAPRRDARFAWDDRSVLLFAHRGVSEDVPENTQAALEAARRLGFPGVELDIRKTRDGEFVVFHDPVAYMLGLVTNLSDLTLAQITNRALFKGTFRTTNSVPALRRVFEKHGHAFRFYLDTKERGFRDADQLARLIREYGLEERCVVASVDPLFVAYLEHWHPRVNTALERFDAAQVWLYRLTPRKWKPDFLSGFARKATPGHLAWLRRNNLLSQRIVYEVTTANYRQVIDSGISKAIVDYAPGVYSAHLVPPAE